MRRFVVLALWMGSASACTGAVVAEIGDGRSGGVATNDSGDGSSTETGDTERPGGRDPRQPEGVCDDYTGPWQRNPSDTDPPTEFLGAQRACCEEVGVAGCGRVPFCETLTGSGVEAATFEGADCLAPIGVGPFACVVDFSCAAESDTSTETWTASGEDRWHQYTVHSCTARLPEANLPHPACVALEATVDHAGTFVDELAADTDAAPGGVTVRFGRVGAGDEVGTATVEVAGFGEEDTAVQLDCGQGYAYRDFESGADVWCVQGQRTWTLEWSPEEPDTLLVTSWKLPATYGGKVIARRVQP